MVQSLLSVAVFATLSATAPATSPAANCALSGPFYNAVAENLAGCLSGCIANNQCGGFSWKSSEGTGEPSFPHEGNCTGAPGQPCCYMQTADAMGVSEPRDNFTCWERPQKPGATTFDLGNGKETAVFNHFWEQVRVVRSPIVARLRCGEPRPRVFYRIGHKLPLIPCLTCVRTCVDDVIVIYNVLL